MRNSFFVLFVIALVSMASCRTEFDFQPSTGNLKFSRDTVYLDTVFTNIGSSTYTLMVYNKSSKNIAIPSIGLGKGTASKYRLTVDGMTGANGEGKIFENVELLAKDSLFIHIETTVDIVEANPVDFLYTDQIKFGAGTNLQTVELVTLIQDAVFLYPQKLPGGGTETLQIGDKQVYGFFLSHDENNDEFIWTNDKPYVIYGYAAVPSGETLTVEAGARVHFHAESALIIGNGGTLKVNGSKSETPALENEVIFEGDRLEPWFADVPGQWESVWFTSGSTGHDINHLTIKNAIAGMRIENNSGEMRIRNTQIYNCSLFGIRAITGSIKAENLVIGSASQASIACLYGGSYDFTHCTFNNEWPLPSSTSVILSNNLTNAEPQTQPLVQANFKNCIIYGSNQNQIFLSEVAGTDFKYKFNNCLIKFIDSGNRFASNPLYDFTNQERFVGNLIEKNFRQYEPKFLNTDANKYMIGEDSPAKAAADFNFSTGTFDILGKERTNPSDIGAYNFIIFEK